MQRSDVWDSAEAAAAIARLQACCRRFLALCSNARERVQRKVKVKQAERSERMVSRHFVEEDALQSNEIIKGLAALTTDSATSVIARDASELADQPARARPCAPPRDAAGCERRVVAAQGADPAADRGVSAVAGAGDVNKRCEQKWHGGRSRLCALACRGSVHTSVHTSASEDSHLCSHLLFAGDAGARGTDRPQLAHRA